MNSQWYKNQSDKEARKKELLSYLNAFDALTELLQEETLPRTEYDCPSWSHKQADTNGYNRAIRHVKSLISFKDS